MSTAARYFLRCSAVFGLGEPVENLLCLPGTVNNRSIRKQSSADVKGGVGLNLKFSDSTKRYNSDVACFWFLFLVCRFLLLGFIRWRPVFLSPCLSLSSHLFRQPRPRRSHATTVCLHSVSLFASVFLSSLPSVSMFGGSTTHVFL